MKKNYLNQEKVVKDICKQLKNNYTESIHGVMLESNLKEGKQNINDIPLKYGVSITDSCISLKKTEELLDLLNEHVKLRNNYLAENLLK